ncbi:HAD family phosphatase [candidate division KSB1 bacterium]|nr:HAD family phosphatase [candidate division KSB1 bacterium]
MLDTIIFDMDGVIIDSESLWDKGTERFLGRHQRAYNRKKSKHLCTGKSIQESTKILQQIYAFEGESSELTREWLGIIKQLYATELTFIDGFADFFSQIRRNGYSTAVATTCSDELLEIVETRLRLAAYFGDHIYTLTHVHGKSKPEPDLFLHAAKKLNRVPGQCIVIEDAPLGIEAAKRAGMLCIALTTSYEAALLQSADLIVSSFRELTPEKLPRF